jgi:hypothetical protein
VVLPFYCDSWIDLRLAAFSLIRSIVFALSKSLRPSYRPRPPARPFFLGVLKLKGLFFISASMGIYFPAPAAKTFLAEPAFIKDDVGLLYSFIICNCSISYYTCSIEGISSLFLSFSYDDSVFISDTF